jgi:hypothetical protein
MYVQGLYMRLEKNKKNTPAIMFSGLNIINKGRTAISFTSTFELIMKVI